MNENRKKMLIVVFGLLVFAPLIGWRSWRASQLQPDPREADWSKLIKEERLAEAPAWYSPREVVVIHKPPEGPHIRLATLRFQQRRDHLKSVSADPNFSFPPLYARMVALHADAYLNERIDDQVPGLPADTAELVQAAYLHHAGEVPKDVRAAAERFLCQATEVLPDTAAEESGMRAGDDFLEVAGGSVLGSDVPCQTALERLKAPQGTRIALVMLRNGERVNLELVKRGEINGFAYMNVPILDTP